MSPDALPFTVREYVQAFVRRRRRLALASSLAAAVGLALGWFVVVGVLDRLLHLPNSLRLAALGANGLAVLIILYRPIRAMFGSPSPLIEAAGQIECRTGAFDQQLLTVISQLLERPEHRGSEQILRQLTCNVEHRLVRQRPARLLPVAPVVRAWVITMLVVGLVVGLCMFPRLNFPQLLARQIMPWADIPPVTTTLLSVGPGDVNLVQGQPLTIRVWAQRLGLGPVLLRHSSGGAWTEVRMSMENSTLFTYTFESLDRDLKYQVMGGDAVSRVYSVRVHPRPAVREFRMDYAYPDYLDRPPLQVVNDDGLIEAPVGSVVDVSILSTVPLQQARLEINGRLVNAEPTIDPLVRIARIEVERDGVWRLTLVDAHGVVGHGPGDMPIRAVPDRPPLLRVLLPDNDLRLHPRDSLEIPYRVLDDHGIHSLRARIQVNAEPRGQIPLPIPRPGRLVEDLLKLDLATVGLQLGDVLSIRLEASDGAGQTGSSEDVRVLAALRSVDAHAARRAMELRDAYLLAERLVEELESALRMLDDAGLGSEASRQIAAMPAVASAAQLAGLISRPLLRALVHSQSPLMSDVLSQWIDQSHLMAHRLERHDDDLEEPHSARRERLWRQLERAKTLRDRLETLWKSQRAAVVLADRDHLTSMPSSSGDVPDPNVSPQMERTRKSIDEGIRILELDPDDPELDRRLKEQVDAGDRVVSQARLVDFVELARRWAADSPGGNTFYDHRLAIASQAEAVRPDAHLLRARDLNLIARAVRRIDQQDHAAGQASPARASVTQAVQALVRQHALHRAKDQLSEQEREHIIAQAEQARRDLRHWAGEMEPAQAPQGLDPSLTWDDPAINQFELEHRQLAAALEAGALTQQGLYDQAEAIDLPLDHLAASSYTGPSDGRWTSGAWGRPWGAPVESNQDQPRPNATNPTIRTSSETDTTLPPHVHRRQQAMQAARRLDELRAEQDRLRRQTRDASPAEAEILARRQEELARRIEQLRQEVQPVQSDQPPRSREQAIEAIRQVQRRLLTMPQEISQAQRSEQSVHQAFQRLKTSQEELESADELLRPVAQRALQEAQRRFEQALELVQQDLKPLMPDTAIELAERLAPFAPETLGAVAALRQQLHPALVWMHQSSQARDIESFDRSTRQTQQAIAQVQEQLRRAQQELMAQDPFFAARTFAHRAADELSRRPPDTLQAVTEQTSASDALNRAWDDSIQQAAVARMQGLPAMSWLFSFASGETLTDGSGGLMGPIAPLAAVRQWGRVRPRGSEVSIDAHQVDPPGYEEALRVYFQTLGGGATTRPSGKDR